MFRESHAVMWRRSEEACLVFVVFITFFTVTCHGVTLHPYPSKIIEGLIDEKSMKKTD